MPLKFTDLPMMGAPVFKGTAAAGATAAISNLLQAQQQREMKRYHDIMKEQEDRRMDQVAAAQSALEESKKLKMAAEILKAQKEQERADRNERETTMLKAWEMSLTNPMGAQALLANRGMLVQPQQPQTQPMTQQPQASAPTQPRLDLPPAAIAAGIDPQQIAGDIAALNQARVAMPGEAPIMEGQQAPQQQMQEPTDTYSVEAGGQTFGFSQQGEMKKRVEVAEDLFARLLEGAPEANREVATQVLNMAPAAVKATQGDTQKAADMLLDLYQRTIPKGKAKKSGSGRGAKTSGKRSAGKKWFEAYKFGYNKAESFLQKNKYIDQIKALEDVKLARQKLLTGGSTDHKEAIILMARALQGGRLTDKDIEIAEGFKSLQQEVERFFSTRANKEAKLPQSIIKPLIRALDNTTLSKYDNIKTILETLKRKRETTNFKEEEDGVDAFLEPELDRFPDLMGRNKKIEESPKESKTNKKSLAQQMAEKYGKK